MVKNNFDFENHIASYYIEDGFLVVRFGDDRVFITPYTQQKEYQLSNLIPEKCKSSLPSIDELEGSDKK